MWDKNGLGSKKDRSQTEHEKRKKRRYHLNRVWAEIRVQDFTKTKTEIIRVRLVINDFTVHGVSVFAPKSFIQGQPVSFYMESPKRFFIQGFVQACSIHTLKQSVMSKHPLDYRVVLQFSYNSTEEIEAVQAVCQEIAEECLAEETRARKIS